MDELEKIFRDHRTSFNRLEANDKMWEAIKNSVKMGNNSKVNDSFWSNHKRTILGIAASLIVLIGISSVLIPQTSKASQFVDLHMTSPSGEIIKLDPSLNKYTLIQFWASGNVLCDEKNCYYYLPAYEKYRDKGFEIYAISLDEDKEQWIRSIEDNNLPWIHVSDLKGWESPICIECNISKIPTTFLLDSEGNIVLEDLNAEILDETLSKLLADN